MECLTPQDESAPHASQLDQTVVISARELPEAGAFTILTRVERVGTLVREFQERSLASMGLRFIDFSVLRVLQVVGEPHEMTPSELAEHVERSTAGVTQIVDRLAADGFVDRRLDPSDRRRSLVVLTAAGLSTVETARLSYARDRDRLLSQVSDRDLAVADRVLRQVCDLLGTGTGPEDLAGSEVGSEP